MKRMNKVLLSLLALSLCLFMTWINPQSASAKAKFNCITEKTALFAGNTYKVLCYGSSEKTLDAADFSYESSNPSVATVSADGVITGVSYGDAVITVTSKGKLGTNTCNIHIYEDTLTIKCGSKEFKTGKNYQFTANKNDVIWGAYNVVDDNPDMFTFPNASIDSKSGKVMTRNAGRVYIYAHTSDGKSFGAVYITCQGPIITGKPSFDPITLDKDLGVVDFSALLDSGLLPQTASMPYTDGDKTGNVECEVDWNNYISEKDFKVGETYKLYPRVIAPKGYTVADMCGTDVTKPLEVTIAVKQTDNRVAITELKDLTITLDKDEHITSMYAFLNKYFTDDTHSIIAVTEKGDEVKLGISRVNIPEVAKKLDKKETYTDIKVTPLCKAGYVNSNNLSAALKIVVNTPQTEYEDANDHLTLDDIAMNAGDFLTATQETLK